MSRISLVQRLAAATLGGSLVLCMVPVYAQAPEEAWLFLRPHCASPISLEPLTDVPGYADVIKNSPDGCANYRIRDPQSQETDPLGVGDILDMDLVLLNPSHTAITEVRAALSYDPQVLDGISIELTQALPIDNPAETDFFPNEGLVKIVASANPGGEPVNGEIAVARIRMKVARHRKAGLTVLGFSDIQRGVLLGGTQIAGIVVGEPANIIASELGSLVVRTKEGATAPSSATASSAAASSTASAASSSPAPASSASSAGGIVVPITPPAERTPYVLLQVTGVRIGAKKDERNLYLTWDRLNSAETAGYNIYYGTVQGRYIQRVSIEPNATSHIIRDLPIGTVYYVAIRAFNQLGEESAFSREVMVKIGDPNSSTSRILLQGDPGPGGQNPLQGNLNGDVPGASGLSTDSMIVVACIAIVISAIAFRRYGLARQRS